MLLYHNYRFYWKNLSFQIPDGFFLDSKPEMEIDNFLRLWFFDGKHSLTLHIVENGSDTKCEMERIITEIIPEWSSPIEPVTINGLSGHYAEYHLSCSKYYEAWLHLEGAAVLNIVIAGFIKLSDADIAAVFAAIDPKIGQEM